MRLLIHIRRESIVTLRLLMLGVVFLGGYSCTSRSDPPVGSPGGVEANRSITNQAISQVERPQREGPAASVERISKNQWRVAFSRKSGWFNTGIVLDKLGIGRVVYVTADRLYVDRDRDDRFQVKYNGVVYKNRLCGVWSSNERYCVFVDTVEAGGSLFIAVPEPIDFLVTAP